MATLLVLLPPCSHPTEWVETKGEHMSYFKGKGTPAPEFQSRFCTNFKNDIGVGQEIVIGESPITTLLHKMIGDYPAGMFPFRIDFRHFTTVSRNMHFTYWLCDVSIFSNEFWRRPAFMRQFRPCTTPCATSNN